MPRSRTGASTDARIALLLDNLDRAFRGPSWHGTSLRGTLRGLTPDLASWRPGPKRNCVWDLLLHAAYWKYVVRRRLTGEDRGSFPRDGANFPSPPAGADARGLRADVALLDAQHELLRAAIAALAPSSLDRRLGSWRVVDYAMGAAAHDLYHAGQINLVKRLCDG